MLHDLRLQGFRSYTDDSFEFDPGVNIIVGPNASGKTNLLEALLFLATGSSYRARDRDVVAHQADWGRLDSNYNHGIRTVKLQVNEVSNRVEKSFEMDGLTIKRLQLADTLPVVVFEPSHLQLLTGSPERRREFLDGILARTRPGFTQLLRQYTRTLAQRNALLKQRSGSRDQLFAWNIRISELGGRIAEQRIELTTTLNQTIEQHYREVSGGSQTVEVTYQSECGSESYGSSMLRKLERHEEQDFARGFTGFGPHRDDMAMMFNGRGLNEAASRGEVRTLLLGLKILELKLIEKARDQKPLLLLDDVFSELDGARRRALTDFLKGHQTFITTTDADVVVEHFMQSCRVIPVSSR